MITTAPPVPLLDRLKTFLTSPDKPALDQALNQRLQGMVKTDAVFILNGQKLKALTHLSLYVLNEKFNLEREEQGQEHDTLRLTEFALWLYRHEAVIDVNETVDITTTPLYTLYPFSPSYNDVVWTTRVLKNEIHEFQENDIYLLSVYRDTEIAGIDVEKTIIARDVVAIKQMLAKIVTEHQKHVDLFNNTKPTEDEDDS